jgi:hypothetical protein
MNILKLSSSVEIGITEFIDRLHEVSSGEE